MNNKMKNPLRLVIEEVSNGYVIRKQDIDSCRGVSPDDTYVVNSFQQLAAQVQELAEYALADR